MSRPLTPGEMELGAILFAAMTTPPRSAMSGVVDEEQSKDGQDDDGADVEEDGQGGEGGQDDEGGHSDGQGDEKSQSGRDTSNGQDDEAGAGNGGHTSWKVNKPQALPLTFRVPTSATTWKIEQLNKEVDFTSKASVTAANKAARQVILRARNALGLPPLRPSTRGREFDQERDDVIEALYIDYAEQNSGARIWCPQLVERYNNLYPDENRSSSSISAHVDRTPQLKTVRDKYRKA